MPSSPSGPTASTARRQERIQQRRPRPPPCFRNASGYFVDLVTPIRSRADDNPVSLPQLGAGAAPLQHLAWLIEGAVRPVALWGAGVPLSVPQPARFAVHKLILAQRRNPGGRLKRAKDLAQAAALIDALGANEPFAVEDALQDAFGQGDRGWRAPLARLTGDAAHAGRG